MEFNGRSCQSKWFETYCWLHYVNYKDIVLCYPSALASKTKDKKTKSYLHDTIIDTGFNNWKTGTKRLSVHEKKCK